MLRVTLSTTCSEALRLGLFVAVKLTNVPLRLKVPETPSTNSPFFALRDRCYTPTVFVGKVIDNNTASIYPWCSSYNTGNGACVPDRIDDVSRPRHAPKSAHCSTTCHWYTSCLVDTSQTGASWVHLWTTKFRGNVANWGNPVTSAPVETRPYLAENVERVCRYRGSGPVGAYLFVRCSVICEPNSSTAHETTKYIYGTRVVVYIGNNSTW